MEPKPQALSLSKGRLPMTHNTLEFRCAICGSLSDSEETGRDCEVCGKHICLTCQSDDDTLALLAECDDSAYGDICVLCALDKVHHAIAGYFDVENEWSGEIEFDAPKPHCASVASIFSSENALRIQSIPVTTKCDSATVEVECLGIRFSLSNVKKGPRFDELAAFVLLAKGMDKWF